MGASRELAELASAYNSGGLPSFKNRIINGDMRIDQRNAGAAVTASGSYLVDRFIIANGTDGAFSAQQDSSAPAGFVNSVKVTTTTADGTLTAAQNLNFQQRVEGTNVADLGWGTANAKTVTLSFWVRSSLTGTFGGAFVNNDANRSYPFTYSISAADTWEYKTVTIAGDTSGTWLTTTGMGLRVFFSLGAGPDRSGTAGAWNSNNNSSATGAVSVIGTLNATWYITGVQLEKGSTATSFDYRPYGTELALCRRYFTKYYQNTIGSIGDTGVFNMAMWAGNSAYTAHWFQVSMRAGPSFSYSANSDFTLYSNGATRTPSNITQQGSSADRCEITVDIASSLTGGNSSWLRITGTNGFIAWSAEL